MRNEILKSGATLAHVQELYDRLSALLAVGDALTLDLTEIGDADISFVQLLVSASLMAERSGHPLTLTGLSPDLLGLFTAAGVAVDPALGRIGLN